MSIAYSTQKQIPNHTDDSGKYKHCHINRDVLVIAKAAVFSAEGVFDGVCLPGLMVAKPERRSKIWASGSKVGMRE